VIFLKVNFGGFVPLSTVDWRGRSVCTVFLRGCPVHCFYCQNENIRTGSDLREIDEIIGMIKKARLLISGVVFSGGEPTMQKDALIVMAIACKKMGLGVGIHTNGVFPETIKELIDQGVLGKVALDLKTSWDNYDELLKKESSGEVKKSLAILKEAYKSGKLPEFEVVFTIFPGMEEILPAILKEAEGVDFVLQQGVLAGQEPLTFDRLAELAYSTGRIIKIRTRDEGELVFENGKIYTAGSILTTELMQPENGGI